MTNHVEYFRDHLIAGGVMDPEGTHHEFVSGMHGQKIDFDTIETGSDLYKEWVDVNVEFLKAEYEEIPPLVIGVANGTNRLALDVGRCLEGQTCGLVSEKDEQNSKVLRLSQSASGLIKLMRPKFVAVLEDVGTTGSNSVQVARQVLAAGAQDVEVIITWKRREQLERLDASGISYRAIIDEALTTYSPEECEKTGFCAQGWELIPRS